jgi:signal transduction histidine kinase
VVSNILRFTKLQPLQLEQALLPEILSEALAVFEAQLQEGQIQVIREEQPGLRPIKVDPSQMQQVFMNLILNARKAMPEGGELKIRIHLTKENDKATQVVEFRDTGPELSPERLEEIFKPFYTKKSGDTGLGLSVAQKIVSSHGGKLAAHGQVERGTVFTVTLPEEGPTKTSDTSATSVSHPLEVG